MAAYDFGRGIPVPARCNTTSAQIMSASEMTEQQKHDAINAEARAGQWLADGNEAREAGNAEKAERCYTKAQYWLDRYNKLTGRA